MAAHLGDWVSGGTYGIGEIFPAPFSRRKTESQDIIPINGGSTLRMPPGDRVAVWCDNTHEKESSVNPIRRLCENTCLDQEPASKPPRMPVSATLTPARIWLLEIYDVYVIVMVRSLFVCSSGIRVRRVPVGLSVNPSPTRC